MRLLGTAAAASSPDELKDARGFTEAYISNPHAMEVKGRATKRNQEKDLNKVFRQVIWCS